MAGDDRSVELGVEARPDAADVALLGEQIYRFNVAQTERTDGQELAIFVRDAAGEIRAGLYGWTWAGWLEVRYLWVHEAWRGRGHGSRLLLAAEREARARGCHTALLDTHTFQAPGFYERHGYRVCATIDGYPSGYQKLFLTKRLDGDGAAPGEDAPGEE